MIKISKRAARMATSATLAMAAKAAELRTQGVNVISFATGEPDFDTPERVRSTCKKALDAGQTRYTPSAGIPDLKAAIAAKLERDNNLKYDTNQIVVTCGAKQAIYNALQVILDPGDEVLVPSPYWVSYPDQIFLCDGIPVTVPTSDETSFKVTPTLLTKLSNKKTKALILNSPSNPSGTAYTREELIDIAKFCVLHNIAIISDEIYEKLTYDGFVHTSIADAHPPAKDITITINGVSKAYAMTGWRMGYAAGPKDIISKMATLVGQQISGIPGFVQSACVDALKNCDGDITKMRTEFAARRDLMLSHITKIPNVKCRTPKGAFYLFPDMKAYVGKKDIADTSALVTYLLAEAHIATVAGDSFGAPGFVRFSYATSRENIVEGMERLAGALGKI